MIAGYKVGFKKTINKKITREMVDNFAKLTGDYNPLHVDAEYAKVTEFKKPVVHGMLGANFVSTLIGMELPGKGALWLDQKFNFLSPIRINDSLNIMGEVIEVNSRHNILTIAIEITNQLGKTVIEGSGHVTLVELTEQVSAPKVICRSILLIGGTSDIGESIIESFADQNLSLTFTYHSNKEKAKKLCNKFQDKFSNLQFLKFNVKENGLLDDSLTRHNIIVYLPANPINNYSVLNTNETIINQELELSCFGFLKIINANVPYMHKQRFGRIVALSSEIAGGKPTAGWLAYSIGKHALESIIKQCALELAPHGITSNAISPSLIDTNLTAEIPKKAKTRIMKNTPTQQLTSAKDVAYWIHALVMDESGQLNGQILRINGAY
jgi:3-oxoacyl-[acyl-carrier protein] reductase